MDDQRQESVDDIIRDDARYPPQAYAFLRDGLGNASKDIYGETSTSPRGERHVTGEQLCLALRDLAIERWGMLARTVLENWNIRATIDFGNMVYLLIEHKIMKRTEEDSIEHFRDVFDFETGFEIDDKFELKE